MNLIYRFDVSAILISSAIIISLIKERTVKTTFVKIFNLLVVLILGISITDLICTVMQMNQEAHTLFFLFFWKIVYQLFYHSLPICFYMWIYYGILEKTSMKKLKAVILWFPYVFVVFMILTSPINNWMMYFDETKTYKHGTLMTFAYVESIGYIIYGLISLFKDKVNFNRKEIKAIFVYSIMSLFAVVIQLIMPNIRITTYILSLCILLGYFTLDNPSDYIDKELKINNKRAFITILKKIISDNISTEILSLKIDSFEKVRSILGREKCTDLQANICDFLIDCFGRKNLFRLSDCIFVVILEKNHEERLKQEIELQKRFKKPFACGNNEIMIDILINVVNFPDDSNTLNEIMDFLENAFSDDVFELKNNIHHINKSILDKRHRTNNIIKIMEKALLEAASNNVKEDSKSETKKNGFDIVFQPLYSVVLHKFCVVEVFLRLYDEECGEIEPSEFIPIAEENGLILRIGDYVLRSTCEFISKSSLWEYGIDHVNINLSYIQCMQENLYESLCEIINSYSINYQYLHFEVTDNTTKSSNPVVKDNMLKLKRNNINFTMDNYGSKNCNVIDLVEYPFRGVKIDKSIVWSIMKDEKSRIFLSEFILMLKSLKQTVIAVGVENQEQEKTLIKLGCDYLQGFYYSYPLSSKELLLFLRKNM